MRKMSASTKLFQAKLVGVAVAALPAHAAKLAKAKVKSKAKG